MKKLRTIITIATLVLFTTLAFAAPEITGKVTATMNGDGYSFVQIEKDEVKTWVAVPETQVEKGATITFTKGMPAKNFKSETLGTSFEVIYFSPGIAKSSKSISPPAKVKPSQSESKKTSEVTKSPKPTALSGECVKGDCQNGQGTFSYFGNTEKHMDGAKYVGDFKAGLPNGQGTLTLLNDKIYVGEFKDGAVHGQGTFTRPDGYKHEGEWVDFIPNGQGTQVRPNGEEFSGEFKDGKLKDGRGKFLIGEGRQYEGEWKEFKPHGQGVMYFPDNTSYEGEWKDGKPHGQGTQSNPTSGRKYEGEWKDGKYHGQGTFRSARIGKKYVGEFKEGQYHRHGTWSNDVTGEKYVGEFKDGERHGQGTYTPSFGKTLSGEWKNGQYVGR